MRLFVIANTTAKALKTRPTLLHDLRRAAGGHAEVHATRSLEELARVAQRAAAESPDAVALAGGDGTLMAGVSALRRAMGDRPLPLIAPLPCGTVATVARNLGIRGNPVRILGSLAGAEARSEVLATPTLHVRAELPSGATEERVGFIFGTGLVARFFDLYEADGARGLAAAARIVARIFGESFVGGALAARVLTPLPCRIEVDGRALDPRAWSLVCAAVVRDLGLSMRVTYRAAEDPLRPHLVASPLAPQKLGPRAPRVLMGRSIGGEGHFDDLVGSFRVVFDDEGPYVLDGDALRARSIGVAAGPMLRILRLKRS